jgi:hypothetical protein
VRVLGLAHPLPLPEGREDRYWTAVDADHELLATLDLAQDVAAVVP